METEKIKQLQQWVDQSDRIVFFGGAGVSTESGIPDFRSQDGLYHQQYDVPPETILSHTYFERHTAEFYRFYRNKMICLTAKPNAAHKKLAELEQAGKLLAVVTQNIDGLHQLAGSRSVLELHGSVHRNICQVCGAVYDAEWIMMTTGVPHCDKCGGSGYVGSTMCECLSELCRQEQKKEISVLSSSRETFSQFRLDYYPDAVDPKYGASPRTIMERTLNICRRYAATFTPNAGNLLFIGGTGLGKTFLSACIARTVTDRGYSVVYETSNHLFSKLEQAKFNPSDDTRREATKLTNSDLLILDDLGTEMPGQFVTAALYSLLNDRMMAVKPMVISTNLNVDELSRRYSPQIASRLHGDFQRLTFVGNDIRVLKNRGL